MPPAFARLSKSLSVWTKRSEFPEPLFIVWNTAVTAWHITDWLWQSTPEIRAVLAKRYGLQFSEGSKSALRNGLEEFQDAVAKESRHLYVCREIANGSKHMRKNNVDPDVTALARWDRVAQGAGCVQPGDLTMSLVIIDGDHEEDASAGSVSEEPATIRCLPDVAFWHIADNRCVAIVCPLLDQSGQKRVLAYGRFVRL